MPMFVLTYHSGPGYTPAPRTQAAWQAWFAGIGDQLADMGKPVIARTALGDCSPESTEPTGRGLRPERWGVGTCDALSGHPPGRASRVN